MIENIIINIKECLYLASMKLYLGQIYFKPIAVYIKQLCSDYFYKKVDVALDVLRP